MAKALSGYMAAEDAEDCAAFANLRRRFASKQKGQEDFASDRYAGKLIS